MTTDNTVLNPHTAQLLANLADLCARHGVQQFILSPGSRSAPLTVTFARHPQLTCRVVMDERAAAYIALGIAQQTGQPTGLVCTSGTAALNYAPAVAEAYYQGVPLLLFTADRPPEWLDQQDNQTIHQRGVFGEHVRGSFELPVDVSHPDAGRHAIRLLSEAINLSLGPQPGPVHINVPLREPLYPAPGERTIAQPQRPIVLVPTTTLPNQAAWQQLVAKWQATERKLIIAGLHRPDSALTEALLQLQDHDRNTVVISDIAANQQAISPAPYADLIFGSRKTATQAAIRPDLVITFGGQVVSKTLKLFLRAHPPSQHWHLHPDGAVIDTYQALTTVIPTTAAPFFAALTNRLPQSQGDDYRQSWATLNQRAAEQLHTFLQRPGFSELQVVATVMAAIPPATRLQLGNSMPVRYAGLLGLAQSHTHGWRVNSNRGVSGIDGTVSTALGAALTTANLTVLLVGDLAFFYDRNAWWHQHIPTNLRVILLNNGGGNIFKMIPGPTQLDPAELHDLFYTPHGLTAQRLAEDYNLAYFTARNETDLSDAITACFDPTLGRAAILEIFTDSNHNADVYKAVKTEVMANL